MPRITPSYHVSIIGGCGHVGLPLGVAFALKGCDVTLVDINEAGIATVNGGRFPFMEKGGDEALRKVVGKNLKAEKSSASVSQSDCVIFVTGTPVDEHLNPRIEDVTRVLDHYLPMMHAGQLVILRSTVFPGVTEMVTKKIQAAHPGVSVAFCPERVAQGFALEEIFSIPQIVSAFDKEAEDRAAELFAKIAPEILRLTPREAELTKLFANAWRYISFAIANQFYVIAEGSGVSFERVYQALSHNYPRANYAHPGFAAGPCLFKDTMQLSAFHNNNFFLGHAAMLINEGLPHFVVEQLEKKMDGLAGKKVGLLGMAFKANSDDTRESLSYKIKKVLESKLAIVMPTDVYQESSRQLDEIVRTADGFILGVPHQEYKKLDLRGKPFADCWGVWEKKPDLSQTPHPQPAKIKAA